MPGQGQKLKAPRRKKARTHGMGNSKARFENLIERGNRSYDSRGAGLEKEAPKEIRGRPRVTSWNGP